MPIHDWSRVDAGTFHDFHHGWITHLKETLNGGLLPPGFSAMAEQIDSGAIPDVLTLEQREPPGGPSRTGGTVAAEEAPPRARLVASAESDLYTRKANRIAIKHRLGQVSAVIEVVSPGNKSMKKPGSHTTDVFYADVPSGCLSWTQY